jgi:hypothetical protein
MIAPSVHDLPKWRRINTLLEVGLALPPLERESWLVRVASEHADLIPLLRALLAREGVRAGI